MAPELKPVYLLAGSDRPKIDPRARSASARRFGRGRGRACSPRPQATGEDAVAACNALGLFGDARLVSSMRRRTRSTSGWKAADAKAIAAYLDEPGARNRARARRARAEEDSPLAKACAKAARCWSTTCRSASSRAGSPSSSSCTAPRPSRGVPAARRARRRRPRTSSRARSRSSRPGPAASRSASARSRLLAAPRAEAPMFALTDAWGARDAARDARARARRLERDAGRVATPRRASSARSRTTSSASPVPAARGGGRPRRATRRRRLKLHPFYVEKVVRPGARTSPRTSSRDAVVRLAELDLALKGASRLRPSSSSSARSSTSRRGAARRERARSERRRRAARPATSCARPCSGAARRARPPGRSSWTSSRCSARSRSASPVLDGRLEALRQRLDRRAVAQVLEPLARGGADALLLLLDVRHGEKRPALAGAAMVAERSAPPRRAVVQPDAAPILGRVADDPAGRPTAPARAARLVDGDLLARDRPLARRSGSSARSSPRTTSASAGRSTPSRSRSRSRTWSARSSPTPRSRRAFVPVFSELLEKGERARAWRVASSLFWLMLLGLGGLTALFILVAPLLMPPLDRTARRPRRRLSRVLFPIVVLLGLSGIIVGILNSYEQFTSRR